MTQHSIKAEIEVQFQPAGMQLPPDEREVAYPTLEITYSFTKGAPEVRYQRNDGPGHPPEAAEIEVTNVALLDGDGLNPTKGQLWGWAIEWINDKGFDKACESAVEDDEGDRADYENDRCKDRDMGL
jgi:hypothetical protein